MIQDTINKTSRKEKCMLICMLFLGVLFMIPRFIGILPVYGFQDSFFHIIRLTGLKNVWTSPINYELNTTGSMVNEFYPWLTMYPMQILYSVTGNYILSYNLFYLFLSIFGFYISYYSIKIITKEDLTSFCFAIIYGFSSYRFANVYYRAALGEAISMTLLPMVLCGIYLILYDDYKKWIVLSFGITLIAYSHLVSLYLSSVFTFLIFILSIFNVDNRMERIVSFFKATFYSVLLSSGMLIQLAYYGLENDLAHPKGDTNLFELNAFSIIDILKNTFTKQYFQYSVGFSVILILMISICLSIAFKKEKYEFAKMLLLLSMILLLCSSRLIPWAQIAQFSLIGVIQFPWRMNAYITLFSISAFSILVSKMENITHKKVLALLVGCVSIIFFFINCIQLWDEKPANAISEDLINNHLVIESLDYIPDEYYIFKNENAIYQLSVLHNNEQLKPISLYMGNDLGILVTNAFMGEEIKLPTCYFSTIHIYCEDLELPVFKSDIGTAMIYAPYDGDLVLDLTNKYDPIIYVFWVISLVSFCFIIIKCVHERKLEHTEINNEECDENEVI